MELSVWGPGQHHIYVGIDLVSPELQQSAVIGAQPGGITVSRGLDRYGESVTVALDTDVGVVHFGLSLESAVALADAIRAAAKNPGGHDN